MQLFVFLSFTVEPRCKDAKEDLKNKKEEEQKL